MLVDLQLGADVDAAHRVVHQDDLGVGAERAGEQRLLLVAAGERQDVVVDVRRLDADALRASLRAMRAPRPALSIRPASPASACERTGDVAAAIDQSCSTPSFCRSPAISATGAGDGGLGLFAPARFEDLQQHARLAMAGRARHRPTISPLMRDQLRPGRPAAAAGAHDHGACRGRRRAFAQRCAPRSPTLPMAATRRRGRSSPPRRSATTPPSFITTMRSQ